MLNLPEWSIGTLGHADRLSLRSLTVGVRTAASYGSTRCFYTGPEEPVAPENNPRAAFDRIFARVSAGDTGMAQQADRRRIEQSSVLDAVRDQLRRLQPRLGAEEGHRVQRHLTGIRELELQLEAPAVIDDCEQPAGPDGYDFDRTENVGRTLRDQYANVLQAFRCDATRFAGVQSTWVYGEHILNFFDPSLTEAIHVISHESSIKMRLINRFFATELAHFASALDAIPEGTGTMLDNTVIVWGSEITAGNNHGRDGMSFLVLGGQNLGIPGGRLLECNGQAQTRLFVSICQQMGATDVTSTLR